MSDIFFIISSVCVVVITILLSVLLIKSIETVDGVNEVVDKTRTATNSIAKALTTLASASSIISPLAGITRGFFKNRKAKSKKGSEE